MFLITILSLFLSLLKWSSLSLLHIPDVERGDRTNLIDPPAKIHPNVHLGGIQKRKQWMSLPHVTSLKEHQH